MQTLIRVYPAYWTYQARKMGVEKDHKMTQDVGHIKSYKVIEKWGVS